MAHEGHVIIKKDKPIGKFDTRRFFTDVDKGSNKPAFCYERKKQILKEEANLMRKAYDNGNVTGGRKISHKLELDKREKRLSKIEENSVNAANVIAKDPDGWAKKHEELKKIIMDGTPTRKDERNRRVNPHKILQNEKSGLGKAKKDFVIISRALGKESNTSFLQRD